MRTNFEEWCEYNNDIGKLSKSLLSSAPEQYIGFYLSKLFKNDIEYQKKFDWLGLSSLDIFIPSLRLAVEYDGGYFHKNRRTSDEYKTNICKSHGISVIRIIEQIDKVSEKVYVDKNVVFYQYQKRYRYFDEVIYQLILVINKLYVLSFQIDVDIDRDYAEIVSYVQEKYYHKSIAHVWPESIDYWDENLNKKSVFDVFYTDVKNYNLCCPKCGRKFTFYMRYFHERKSLIPCQCEVREIELAYQKTINEYMQNGTVPLFDDTLLSRRIYDRMASQIKHFGLSTKEREMYLKFGFKHPFLNVKID